MDILIVDDNEDYLFLLKQVFDQNGYTVHTAKDGMEGCEVLAKSDIDLIISDIRMPRLDGLKMHAFAREIDRYKKTKFIFISGFGDVYSQAIDIDPKLDFLLDKTTSVTDLLTMVDELIFGRVGGAWN
jgi:CheY-like chemotaxis protein